MKYYYFGLLIVLLSCYEKKEQVKEKTILHVQSNDSYGLSNEKIETEIDSSIDDNRIVKINDSEEFDKYETEIRQITGIDDLIEILKVKYFEYDSAYLFIDLNLKSSYNTSLGVDFQSYSIQEKELYSSNYMFWVEKLSAIPRNFKLLEGLTGDWIPINKYNGGYYLYYSHCDHMFEGYTITDTTVINYYMDGPSPHVIDSVYKDQEVFVVSTVNGGEYRFQQVESNEKVFIMRNGRSQIRLVKETHRTAYPCIVELCHELGTTLNVGFDPVQNDE